MQALFKASTRLVDQPDDAHLLDPRRLQVVLLDLFGIDILPRAEHDDLLRSPGDEQIATVVEIAEVAGEEPALAEGGGVGVRTVVIPLHHDASAQRDLSRKAAVSADVCPIAEEPGFHAGERCAHRAQHVVVGRRGEGAARDFGESVSLQDVEAERVQVARHVQIEARTSGHQVAHARAQRVVCAAKEQLAQIDAQLAQRAGNGKESAERLPCEQSARCRFLHDAFVDEIEELWDAAEERDVALAQSTQQLGGVERFQIHDARAVRERKQQVGHLRERVEEGKDSEDGVGRADGHELSHRLDLRQQVVVREHYALRVARRPRRIKDDRRFLETPRHDRVEAASAAGEYLFYRIHASRLAFEQDEAELCSAHSLRGFTRIGEIAFVDKQDRSPTIFQQGSDLFGLEGGVEGDSDASCRDGPEVSRDPARAVVAEEGATGTARYPGFGEPASHRFRHMAQFGVGVALERLLALHLHCDILRPPLG